MNCICQIQQDVLQVIYYSIATTCYFLNMYNVYIYFFFSNYDFNQFQGTAQCCPHWMHAHSNKMKNVFYANCMFNFLVDSLCFIYYLFNVSIDRSSNRYWLLAMISKFYISFFRIFVLKYAHILLSYFTRPISNQWLFH